MINNDVMMYSAVSYVTLAYFMLYYAFLMFQTYSKDLSLTKPFLILKTALKLLWL